MGQCYSHLGVVGQAEVRACEENISKRKEKGRQHMYQLRRDERARSWWKDEDKKIRKS